jgi:hypothetical protein
MAANTKVVKPALPVLNLHVPTRLSGDVDSNLEATISERCKTIILVQSEQKDETKGIVVLKHVPSADGKGQVAEFTQGLGHIQRFVNSCANAWTSGTGLSPDGSVVYVATNADAVLKVQPNLKKYDLFIEPAGRGGCAKYRIPLTDLIAQVTARSKSILASVKQYGIIQGKERTVKDAAAKPITIEF